MGDEFKFLIQLGIDEADAIKRFQAVYEEMRRTVATETIPLEIQPEMDTSALKAKFQQLEREITALASSIQSAESEITGFKAEATKAAEALDKVLPKAAATLEASFKEGADKAAETLDKLTAEVKKSVGSMSEDMKLLKEISVAPNAQKVLGTLSEIVLLKHEQLKLEQHIKQTGEATKGTKFGSVLANVKKEISANKKILAEALGGDAQKAKSLIAAYARAAKEDIGEVEQSQDGATAALKRYHEALQNVIEAEKRAATLRTRQGEVVPQVEVLRQQLAQAGANAPKANVEVHQTALRESINEVTRNVAGDLAHVKLQVNQPFFINSIREAIAAAEAEGLKINLGAGAVADAQSLATLVGAAKKYANDAQKAADLLDPAEKKRRRQQEIAEQRAEAKARRQEERNQNRGEQVGRRKVMRAAKENPVAWLQAHFPDLAPHAQTIVSAYEKGIPLDEAARRFQAAHEAVPQFFAMANGIEQRNVPDVLKEQMKVFASSFGAEFITAMENRFREVRDKGPRANPQGRLAGVDQIFRNPVNIQAEWEKLSRSIAYGVQKFSGYRMDFGAGAVRDRWAEAQQQFNTYMSLVRRFEKEQISFGQAQTMEDLQRSQQRIEATKRELAAAEDLLRVRLLADQGMVNTPEILGPHTARFQQMPALEAYRQVSGALKTHLGGAYETMLQSNPHLRFDQFTAGLFGGDRGMAKEFLRVRGVTEEILADEQKVSAELERQIGILRSSYEVQTKLEGSVQKQVRTMASMQKARNSVQPYKETLRNAFALVGGLQLGYTAAYDIRDQVRMLMEYQKQIALIQGIIGGSKADAQNISRGVAAVASKYGMNLLDAANAAKVFAQTGMKANEVVKQLDYTMAAAKGLGITIEQIQELQVAVRAVTMDNDKYNQSINYTLAVLDKVSSIERQYAIGAEDLSAAIKTLSPLVDNFSNGMVGLGDAFDYTIGMSTVMVERLRITGQQAANALKMMFGRLSRPEILGKLESDYGLKLKNADTGDLLPLDQLLREFGRKYHSLSGLQQKEFAAQLGGGRQVHAITTLLENYVEVQQIAAHSSDAFGDAQKRAAIGMDTMDATVQRLKTNFALFTKRMADGTHIADGFKAVIGGLASAFGGIQGEGGGLGTLLTLILGGGAAFKLGRSAFKLLDMASLQGGAATLAKIAQSSRLAGGALRGMGAAATLAEKAMGGLGVLADIFTPGGVILAGLAAAAGLLGLMAAHAKRAREELNRYKVVVTPIEQLHPQEAPQYQEYSDIAMRTGFGTPLNAQATLYNMLGQSGGVNVAQFQNVLQHFAGTTDAEQRQWITEHTKELDAFRDHFVDIFISQLPDAQKQLFDGMKTNAEKTKGVIDLISGAAWSASYQMSQAIKDINDATQRMVDDTLAGLDKIEARKQHAGVLASLFGLDRTGLSSPIEAVQGKMVGTGGNQVYEAATPAQQRQAIIDRLWKFGEDSPLLRTYLGNKDIFRAFNAYVLTPDKITQAMAGKGGSYQELITSLLDLVANNPQLREKGAMAMNLATAGANGDAGYRALARRYDDAALLAGGATSEQMTKVKWARSLNTIEGTATTMVGQHAAAANPIIAMMQQLSAALLAAGGVSTKTGTGGDLDRIHEALFAFQKALIDVTKSMYEAVQKFTQEKQYAQEFGQAYNKGNALVTLGQAFRQAGQNADTQRLMGIIEKSAELQTIASRIYRTSDETNPKKRKPLSETEATKLRGEIDQLRQIGTAIATTNIGDLFKGTPEAQQILSQFKKDLNAALNDANMSPFDQAKTLLDLIQKVSTGLIRAGYASEAKRNQILQDLDLAQEKLQKNQEIEKASLPITATIAQQMGLQYQQATKTYQVQSQALARKLAEKAISVDDYNLAQKKLDVEYQLQTVYDARTKSLEAHKALQTQVRTDIQDMLGGFKNLVTDTSIWDAILNPKGNSPEERARAKAQAVGDAIVGTIMPIFKTISDRVVDNAFQALTDKLLNMKGLNSLLGGFESKLQAEAQGADLVSTSIIQAFASGAQIISQAITGSFMAGSVGINPMTVGLSSMGSMGGVMGLGGIGAIAASQGQQQQDAIAKWKAEGIAAQKKAQKNALISSAGLMVGNIGGTILGGGGKNAQTGASIGSSGGMILGTIVGGPIGGAIGGALGGLLGGLFGGKHDKTAEDNPVIKGLGAIERAQRETITTIQAQTDALLKPENRFLNLPATFSMPTYMPAFGGGVGGGNRTLHLAPGAVQITVHGDAGQVTEATIRQAVEDAMGNILYDQRSTQSWN